MPLYDFFRNVFIGGQRADFDDEWNNNFRNPIWQNNEDDNGDDDFRHIPDNIIGCLMGINKILTNFDNIINSVSFHLDDNNMLLTPGNIEESPCKEQCTVSLRDQVLKPGYDFSSEREQEKSEVDVDLDGKISCNNLFQSWDNPENNGIVSSVQQFPGRNSIFFNNISIRNYHDGIIEERRIIKDNQGNQKEIISKQIGNKKYITSTEKTKNGVETTINDVINIDKSELKHFQPNHDDNYNYAKNFLNYFPWYQFFGLNPKL